MSSLAAMPFVVFNLGGEMLYILAQRLRAQNIPTEKGAVVLNDVVKAMFSSDFVGELFKPQELYSNVSVRQIFDKVAHSSIMRLSPSSMDKLYDLMTMGVKLQLVSCLQASELLKVTLEHLSSVSALLTSDEAVALVTSAAEALRDAGGRFAAGDWAAVRQTVAGFFQGRRVKVSLFLQASLQFTDASLALPAPVPPPSYTGPPVGSVRPLGPTAPAPLRLPLDAIGGAVLHPPPVVLGGNLYAREPGSLSSGVGNQVRPTAAPNAGVHTSAAPEPLTAAAAAAMAAGVIPASADAGDGRSLRAAPSFAGAFTRLPSRNYTAAAEDSLPVNKETTKQLNLLATLIGRSLDKAGGAAPPAALKLRIFQNDDAPADGAPLSLHVGDAAVPSMTFDSGAALKATHTELSGLVSGLKLDKDRGTPAGRTSGRAASADEPDDLLDLMDQAR